MSNRKNAFLILRINQEFKDKIIKKAKKLNQTVSEFVRTLLEGKL